MAWPAVKQAFTQEQFREYVTHLEWNRWRPSKIVWHNTAAPSLVQWMKSAAEDERKGLKPGISRIKSLENYFKNQNHWPGAPHLFIANDFIWVFNPLTAAGTHSPSYNNTAIGIEMIGDFDREDDDSGNGLKVKNNTIFATTLLCSVLGLDPATAILLHKQDPRTTHDCPGKDIAQDKSKMIASVVDLMSGGEHDPDETGGVIGDIPPPPKPIRNGVVNTNNLNFRSGPGVAHGSTGSLDKGVKLVILDEAKNGSTSWLHVKTPAGYTGWVGGKFVTIGA